MPRQPLVYPDAVLLAIDYLSDELGEDVAVRSEVPKPRPSPLVVVRRTGGTSDPYVMDRPHVDCQVWHADESQAYTLAAQVRALLLGAVGAVEGVRHTSDFAGPLAIPDDETGTPRILLTVTWYLRGAIPEGS